MRRSIIAAVDENWLVGAEGRMPWNLPADMRMFRELTMGKPVIMGRLTFESLGRPLKGRTNIVLSTRRNFELPGAIVVGTLDAAYAAAAEVGAEECMVIGGANVYKQALWHADRLYLSFIHHSFDVALKRDRVYFPFSSWWTYRNVQHVSRREFGIGPDSPYPWTFCAMDLSDFDGTGRSRSSPPASPAELIEPSLPH